MSICYKRKQSNVRKQHDVNQPGITCGFNEKSVALFFIRILSIQKDDENNEKYNYNDKKNKKNKSLFETLNQKSRTDYKQ